MIIFISGSYKWGYPGLCMFLREQSIHKWICGIRVTLENSKRVCLKNRKTYHGSNMFKIYVHYFSMAVWGYILPSLNTPRCWNIAIQNDWQNNKTLKTNMWYPYPGRISFSGGQPIQQFHTHTHFSQFKVQRSSGTIRFFVNCWLSTATLKRVQ